MPTSDLMELVRTWLAANYPQATVATLVVRLPDELPSVVLPILPQQA